LKHRGRPLALISVKTQFENVGDALIVRELLRLIAARARLVVDVSRCPGPFAGQLDLSGEDITVIRRLGWLKIYGMTMAGRLAGARVFHFLVPGGRGGEIPPSALRRQKLLAAIDRFIRLLGVRICQLGVSYGELGPRYAAALRSRARAMHSLAVRDTLSGLQAKRVNIPVAGIVPDLAFNIFALGDRAPVQPGRVAFSFRTDRGSEDAGRTEIFVTRLLDSHPEWSTILLVSQVRRDDAFQRQLADAIPKREGRSVIFVPCFTITEALAAYEGCEAVFSNRLHSLLMAASRGVAPVAVLSGAGDDKIRGIFDDLGATANLCSLTQPPTTLPPALDVKKTALWRERIQAHFDQLLAS